MQSPKTKRRVIITLTALAVVFVCGFISLAFNGNPSSSNTYLGNTSSLITATPQSTMTAMAMMDMALAATQPAAAFSSDAQAGQSAEGYSQVSNRQSSTEQQIEQGQRIVIRNATLSIAVEDTEARVNEIASIAVGLGGWVVSSSTSVSGGTAEHPNIYGNITIRVPAESLDATLETIRGMAVIVNSEQITGQDVTQDYVDTSSQLRNLEAAELQLQTIMLSATNVDEVLSVYNQLVQTRSQIEVARGRLEYYDQASSFSSVTITLNPYTAPVTLTPTPIPAQLGWNPLVTVNRALDSLVRTSQSGVDILITWGVYGLPIVLVFGLPTLLIVRQWRRHNTKRVTIIETEPSTSDGENS